MTYQFANNAATTLAAGITNVATSLTVSAGAGAKFPTPSGALVFMGTLVNASLQNEIVMVTARSGDVLTIVRAQEGTTAVAWNAGDKFELRITAAELNNFAQKDTATTFTQTVTAPTFSGDHTGTISDAATVNGVKVGYRDVPQNSQSAAYTLVLADSGKHILHPSADTTARVFTIPANASVAFPIGAAVTFVNQNAAGVVSIAITTDVMRLAGTGTVGTRTLAANGIATALKITATEWIISGSGLT